MSSTPTGTSRASSGSRRSAPALLAVLTALILALALTSAASAATCTQTFTNTDNVALPDRFTTTLVLPVSGLTSPITDVNVGIHGLNHTFLADLEVSLVGPDGTTVVLFAHTGGHGDPSDTDMIFDDAAETAVQSLADWDEPFNGAFRPQQSLAAFNGRDPEGAWQLVVADIFGGDRGSLTRGWTLEITADETKPTVTVAGNSAAWRTKPVTLKFKPIAGASGLASVEYRLGSGAWKVLAQKSGAYRLTVSKKGKTVVSYRATSVAGTRSAVGTCTVKYDASPPTLKLASKTLNVWTRGGRKTQNLRLLWNDGDSTSARLTACLTQYGSRKQTTFSARLTRRGKVQTIALPWQPRTPGRFFLHLTLTDESGRSTKTTVLIRAHR